MQMGCGKSEKNLCLKCSKVFMSIADMMREENIDIITEILKMF